MAKHGKKYLAALQQIDVNKAYPLEEAIELLKKIAFANFDETVDAVFLLGVDPTKADQMVRGSVVLPHGTGKEPRVLVFAKGEKAKEAKEAGADYVGDEDLIEKIQKEKWVDFDVAIATPDMMSKVGKLGKILGPRGLMPNPKTGTVTFDVKKAVEESKKGKLNFRVDKYGNVHMIIGKRSFPTEHLVDNFLAAYDAILRAKPPAAKGRYIKNVYLSTTMSPSVKVDLQDVMRLAKEKI